MPDSTAGESRAEEQRLQILEHAFASSPLGITIAKFVSNSDCPIVYVNPEFERLTGFYAEEVVGRDCRFLQGADIAPESRAEVRAAIESGKPAKVLLRNYKKSGSSFWNELHLSHVYDEHGTITHLVGIQNDVTDQLEFKAILARQAQYDALTGLANRYLLIDRLSSAVATARAEEKQVAVVILDLDNFKHVNDKYGHMDADHLLMEIGRRICGAVQPSDTVARLGGDEFAIVLPRAEPALQLVKTLDRMLQEVRRPIILGGEELVVTASMGVALFPDDAGNADELMLLADLSMYSIKRSGKNAFALYLPQLRSDHNRPLDVAIGLRNALLGHQFVLHYQPRICAASGEIISFEALIRWQHPTRGLLSPSQFIGIAEDTGLINDIGLWAIQEALRQNAAWRRAGLRSVSVSVNVSSAQVRDVHFPAAVADLVSDSGLPAESLELELTESLLMDSGDLAEVSIRSLKALGVRIAIDDFGSGYSGLRYLSRFPIGAIKIDHFFTARIVSDPTAATICRSIVRLGQDLGLTTVAEGIEHEEQAVLLRSWGTSELQGELFAAPLPGWRAAEYLARVRLVFDLAG